MVSRWASVIDTLERFGAALICYYGLFMTCAMLVQVLDRGGGHGVALSGFDRALHSWFGDHAGGDCLK